MRDHPEEGDTGTVTTRADGVVDSEVPVSNRPRSVPPPFLTGQISLYSFDAASRSIACKTTRNKPIGNSGL